MSKVVLTAEAARIIGVTPATIRVMEQQGKLPAIERTENGVRLFDRETVERVAAERAAKRALPGVAA